MAIVFTMALANYQALRQYQIHSVRPTGKILGNGSYGEVIEAKIPGCVCAVKRMHGIFEREVQGWVDEEMVDENRRKFVNECELMSRLRHPHIVQFLGVCEFPGSDTPALVTELLDTDLHSLLLPPGRASSKPYIPRDFKFSILRDVARGLLFLHSQSPPIIHRDLTATNVLLNSAMVAKIADLGVARLIPEAAVPKLTKGPGNAAYMPPEAEGERYNEALDIFSLGVLSLFTLTQTFPDPLPVKYRENGKFLSRTEAQRRSAFIEQSREEVKEQGWLVDTIQQCLYDDPDKRPTAQGMLSLLENTETDAVEYTGMTKLELVQTIEAEREEHTAQRMQEEKEFQVTIEREREITFQQYQTAIEEKERELEYITASAQQEAAQQREREIVDELMLMLGVPDAGGVESAGVVMGACGIGSGGMVADAGEIGSKKAEGEEAEKQEAETHAAKPKVTCVATHLHLVLIFLYHRKKVEQ